MSKGHELYNRQRVNMLIGHIARYREEQAKWKDGVDWQYTYFANRISEAELEIKERSGLVKKVRSEDVS